jgi:AcrR family transcriptional regulator
MFRPLFDECSMDPSPDKYTTILDVALRLMAEQGFHNTPMALVAKEAQVGIGTIYRYFTTKEELINHVYRHFKQQINQSLMVGVDESLSLRDQFGQLWRNMARYYMAHPTVFKFIEQYSHSPFLSAETRTLNTERYLPVRRFYQRLHEERVIKPLAYEVVMAVVYGTLSRLVKAHIYHETTVTEEMIGQAVGACWDALCL